MNNIEKLLSERYSVRKFQERAVEQAKIDSLVETVRTAPSSKNVRAWSFHFVTDSALLEQLAAVKDRNGGFVKNAPLAIVVVGDQSLTDCWIEDCAIASTILQLTAESLELSSCWIQVRGRQRADGAMAEQVVRDMFGLGDDQRVLCILAIGYRTDQPHTPKIHDNDSGKFFFR